MKKKKILISLFSGIGGFEIAAEWVGWEVGVSCEMNPFGSKVISFHYPYAYHHDDVKTLNYQIINEKLTERFGRNWRGEYELVLSGGFPCQPFSQAGLRKGTNDDRYLWPEMLRLIDELRPTWVCGENVVGINTMVFNQSVAKVESQATIGGEEIYRTLDSEGVTLRICEDFESIGYRVQPIVIPAAGVGAPHRRDRVWFIAHTSSDGHQQGRPSEDRRPKSKGESEGNQWEWFWDDDRGDDEQRSTTNSDSLGRGRRSSEPESNQSDRERAVDQDERQHRNSVRSKAQGRGSDASDSDNGGRKHGQVHKGGSEEETRSRETSDLFGDSVEDRDATNSESSGEQRERLEEQGEVQPDGRDSEDIRACFREFPTQPPICGGNDGVSVSLDSITFPKWRTESVKAYGNAIVPQVAYEIFKAIKHYEENHH